MEYDKRELTLIVLDSTDFDYRIKGELAEILSDGEYIKGISERKEDIIRLIGEDGYNELKKTTDREYIINVVNELRKREIKCITLYSDNYPESLSNIDTPPLVLYTKGNTELLNKRLMAIVGTRKCLPLSVKIAENYTKTLIENGFTIVTGCAEGIDQAVLKAGLDSGIISVIAGGFDNIYPTTAETLLQTVLDKNGLIISESPPSVVPQRYHFPIRNRIFSALSIGALIVAAGEKSGALYTAEYAIDFGKDLFVIPYSVGIASGVGCNDLIKKGGILTDTPEDILEYYGIETEKEEQCYTEEEQEIIELLKDGVNHVEKISEKTGKEIPSLVPTLSLMEIKGIIVKTGVNTYATVKK